MLLPLRCALSSLTVSIPSCCLAAAAAAAPLFLSGSHAAGFVDHRPAVGRVGREPLPVQHRPEAVEHLHDRCHGRCDYCWCASRTATATTATFEPLAAARTRACVPTRVYKSLLLGGSLHRACRSRCLSSAAVAHHLPASFAVSPPRSCSGIGYDMFMNSLWCSWNKGKLWKDIKNNYKEE